MNDRTNRKTIFCDIDGTLLYHWRDLHDIVTFQPTLLPGVTAKLAEWRDKDYYIVLTTARPEGCRSITQQHLDRHGIFYDQLIMGLPVGPRVVINDKKPNGMITSFAVCIDRNVGIENIDI
jgi:hypothetical protein